MQIQLPSRLRRLLFAVACVAGVVFYLQLALRAFLASHLAASLGAPKIYKATKLEPANAEYHELLGRELMLSIASLDDAIAEYRIAVRLNPYVARYWLDLASACQIDGRTSEQAESVEHAVEADPTTPHVASEAGNFFLLQGDLEKALRQFRVVVANNPEAVDSTLLLCWRATGDANLMLDQALSARADLYISFLNLLVQKQQIADAEMVWNRLIALKQFFQVPNAFPYLRFLLERQQVSAAETAWQQLATLDPSLAPYLPSRDNLIINGGFEEALLNGGFDWWYRSSPRAALAIDSSEFHSGSRSLSVTFDGYSIPEVGILQLVPVKSNTDYEFSAEYRSDDLDTASGPRFAVLDAFSNASYVLTDDILDTNPWRLLKARFHTGPNTSLVLVKIIRQPAQPLIRGKLWVDDLSLVEK